MRSMEITGKTVSISPRKFAVIWESEGGEEMNASLDQIFDFVQNGMLFVLPKGKLLCAFSHDNDIVGYDLFETRPHSRIQGVIYKGSVWLPIWEQQQTILFGYYSTPEIEQPQIITHGYSAEELRAVSISISMFGRYNGH